MEADLSRLPAGASGWLSLIEFATSLGDLAEVGCFELKGALSFAERASRKRSAVIVARAILGMSNRMPDVAQRHLGGHGVILVGVDDSRVVGTEAVDGAILGDLIGPYLGADGPRWDHQFIKHADGLVLAVVVDPPQWGDRAFPCRKEYQDSASKLAVRDGDLFVRTPSQTRLATSDDLTGLDLRRSRAPHSGAKVDVEYDATFDRVDAECIRDLVESDIDRRADSLLAGLGPSRPSGSSSASGFASLALQANSWRSDSRSVEEFRADVEDWRTESKTLIEEVIGEFFRHELARGHLLVRNESLRYLEGVRVRVEFPPGVLVLMGSEGAYCDHGGPFDAFKLLPKPPRKYGDIRVGMLESINNYSLPDLRSAVSPVDIDESARGAVVSWRVGELPGEVSEQSDEDFAIVTAGHTAAITAKWTVTARGIDHVFKGELHLHCEQSEDIHLRWGRKG
jgi:hypothetical protein